MRYFRRNIIFHTHVEKAAGTSLVRGLTEAFSESHVYDIRGKYKLPLGAMQRQQKAAIWLLTGHYHYGTQDKYFARKAIYIACVRQPAFRFFSYYNFVKKRPDHPAYKRMSGLSFGEAVRRSIESQHPSANNPMSRMLAGADVAERYLVVAPSHRVNELSAALAHLFGKSIRSYSANSESYDQTVDEDAVRYFTSHNQMDQELYDCVERDFDSWLANLQTRLEVFSAPDTEW